MPNGSDFTVFQERGIPGFNFAFIEGWYAYHTPLDDLAHASASSLHHHADNVLAALRAIDARGVAPDGAASIVGENGPVVAFSVLGSVVVTWGTGTALALPILAVLAALILRRPRPIPAWGGPGLKTSSGRGWIALSLLIPLLHGAVGYGVSAGCSAVTGHRDPWHAYPAPLRLATWIAPIAVTWLLAAAYAGRCRTEEPAGGRTLVLLWSTLALLVTHLAPGASYLFALPAAVLALGRLAFGPGSALPFGIALAVALPLWVPVQEGVEAALGTGLGALVAAPVGLLATFLLPLAARASRAALARTGIAAFVLAAGAFVVAVRVPAYDGEHPPRINLIHQMVHQPAVFEAALDGSLEVDAVVDGGTVVHSAFFAECRRDPAPPALVAAFDALPPLPASHPASYASTTLAAGGPSVDLEPPTAEIRSVLEEGDVLRVRLLLRSPAGAPRTTLTSSFTGLEVHVADEPGSRTPGFASFRPLPPGGLEVVLEYAPGEDRAVVLVDRHRGIGTVGRELVDARDSASGPGRSRRPDHGRPDRSPAFERALTRPGTGEGRRSAPGLGFGPSAPIIPGTTTAGGPAESRVPALPAAPSCPPRPRAPTPRRARPPPRPESPASRPIAAGRSSSERARAWGPPS